LDVEICIGIVLTNLPITSYTCIFLIVSDVALLIKTIPVVGFGLMFILDLKSLADVLKTSSNVIVNVPTF